MTTEKLEFTDQYLVGIKQVDREHRKLFEIVGTIRDALDLEDDRAVEIARRAVAELVEYTDTHFDSEEALMTRAGYPELERHRELHQTLLRQVRDMEMRVELEGATGALELSRFLGLWLVNHIQQADKRFGAFVAARDSGTETR